MSELKNTLGKLTTGLVVIAILISVLTFNSITGLRTGLEGTTEDLSDSIDDLGDSIGELVTVDSALISAIGDVEAAVGASGETVSELLERLESLEAAFEEGLEEPGEKVVFRIGLPTAFQTLDPPILGTDVLNQIDQLVHEPLFLPHGESDGTISFEPNLAESYEQLDELTWLIHIRKGIKFSDGSDLDAKDVWFSFARGIGGNRPPNMVWSFDARVESYEIVNDYTLKMVTKYPMSNLYGWLAQGWTDIISYDAAVASGQEHVYPITGIKNVPGTGPYMYTELEPTLYVKLALNPYWRGKTPQITDIEVYYVPDHVARVTALEAGSLDWISPVPPENIEPLKDAGFTIWSATGTRVHTLKINNIFEPTDNVLVRQAMSHAINYDEIYETIFSGFGERPESVVSAQTGLKNIQIYDYNPEKARQLLKEAGYEDGLTLKMAYRLGDRMGKETEVSGAIQAYFADVGITLEIDIVEKGILTEETSGKRGKYLAGEDVEFEYHLLFHSWGTVTMFMGDEMKSLYDSQSNWNSWYYHNDKFDELVAFSLSDAPLDERIAACWEMQDMLAAEAVTIPIYVAPALSASTPRYTGHIIRPQGYNWFGEGALIP